jgi:hypothetical protein
MLYLVIERLFIGGCLIFLGSPCFVTQHLRGLHTGTQWCTFQKMLNIMFDILNRIFQLPKCNRYLDLKLLYQECISSSVADPGCLSRTRILIFTRSGSRILDTGSRIPDLGSRIPDLGQQQQQKRGVIKFVVKPFFVATNFTKLKIILFFKC